MGAKILTTNQLGVTDRVITTDDVADASSSDPVKLDSCAHYADSQVPKTIRFSSDTGMAGNTDKPEWAIPINPWGTEYRPGDSAYTRTDQITPHQPRWGEEVLPLDIDEFNTAPMEDGARRMGGMAEMRKTAYVNDPILNWGSFLNSNRNNTQWIHGGHQECRN